MNVMICGYVFPNKLITTETDWSLLVWLYTSYIYCWVSFSWYPNQNWHFWLDAIPAKEPAYTMSMPNLFNKIWYKPQQFRILWSPTMDFFSSDFLFIFRWFFSNWIVWYCCKPILQRKKKAIKNPKNWLNYVIFVVFFFFLNFGLKQSQIIPNTIKPKENKITN